VALSVIRTLFGGARYSVIPTSLAYYAMSRPDPREIYNLLMAYYLNNGLYDVLRAAMVAVGTEDEALKPLRNPAARVVEFYVSKMWPGTLPDALPIQADNERVIEAVHQVWDWSNWGAQKQVWARWQATFGDVFVKVATRAERVFMQLINPGYVVDFDTDERGFLTYIRVDVPQVERKDDRIEAVTYTEVWDKTVDSFRTWRHDRGHGAALAQLGQVATEQPITEFGFDFLPWVHVKHRDVGEDRGVGAFTLAIDKIDEANRLATRLHRMLFRHNRNLWVAEANAMDAAGRPLPAPRIGSDDDNTLEIGDDTVVRLPGNSKLSSLVPQINYDAALAILEAHVQELERDLPELAYYRLRDKGDLSGRAILYLLSDAIDRVIEARGNAETGLVRAQEMALTVGQAAGLPGFGKGEIGTYAAGDFAHSFVERPVLAMAEADRAEVYGKYRQAGADSVTAMRRAGFSAAEIEQALEEMRAEEARAQSSLAQALLEQQRRFDQENTDRGD